MRAFFCVLVLVTLTTSPLAAFREQPGAQVQDLKTLSVEELMQIDVTTVSRESERRIDAPAAVSVITSEDIRRYGVDTLADALRLADGVSVARFNGGSWAIAARGFSAITNSTPLTRKADSCAPSPARASVHISPCAMAAKSTRGRAIGFMGSAATSILPSCRTAPAREKIGGCARGGGRLDWELGGRAHLTVQGE